MAVCQFCQKKPRFGHQVSHAQNRTRRLFKPNLQKIPVFKLGKKIRVKVCTRCLQRLKKEKKWGEFSLLPPLTPKKSVSSAVSPSFPPKETVKEKLKVEEIVGKKS